MWETSRYLFLLGALPFIVFGFLHAFQTPLTPDQAKGLAPREPTFRLAMSQETLLLTRRTNVWLAWIGFNFSHSLGLISFGTVVLLIGRDHASFVGQAAVLVPLAVLVSIAYLVLGVCYWFRTPILVTTLASVCFGASWIFMARSG